MTQNKRKTMKTTSEIKNPPLPSSVRYIRSLLASFPCLADKSLEAWDVDVFMARSRSWSTGERHAALFVACVWNPGYAEKQGWRFDALEALGCWDFHNRVAFLSWAATPYWP